MTDTDIKRIVSAIFDLYTSDGGLVYDRAVQRVREVLAASEADVEVKPRATVLDMRDLKPGGYVSIGTDGSWIIS